MCEVLDKVENRGIEKGLQKGLQKGMRNGMRRGRTQGMRLTGELLRKGRLEDLWRAVEDEVYQKQLFAEFGMDTEDEVPL